MENSAKTPDSQNIKKPKDLFELPPEQRATERARLTGSMEITEADDANPAWPICLSGTQEQAIAFIDLLQANIPPEKFGFTMQGQIPSGVEADTALSVRLEGGLASVDAKGKGSAVLMLSYDQKTTKYQCRFGYSVKGTSMVRNSINGGIEVNLANTGERVRDESLFKLYKLTGNPKFMQVLGDIAQLRSEGGKKGTSAAVDPNGYYTALGLNPYTLRFMSEEMFQNIVRGIKREVSRKLHPNAGNDANLEDQDFLNNMLIACDTLENKEKRDTYSSNWLKEE